MPKKPSRKLCQTNRGYGYLTNKPRKGDVCTQNTFYPSCDFENGPREPHLPLSGTSFGAAALMRTFYIL